MRVTIGAILAVIGLAVFLGAILFGIDAPETARGLSETEMYAVAAGAIVFATGFLVLTWESEVVGDDK
jgi:hypothetical protein